MSIPYQQVYVHYTPE